MIEQYEHHGKTVWVRSDLKGHHRQYCLCHSCTKLYPCGDFTNPDDNCPIARKLFDICVRHHVVTPVFECPEYEEKF